MYLKHGDSGWGTSRNHLILTYELCFTSLPFGREVEDAQHPRVSGCTCKVKSFENGALHKHPLTLTLSPDGERENSKHDDRGNVSLRDMIQPQRLGIAAPSPHSPTGRKGFAEPVFVAMDVVAAEFGEAF